MEECVHVVAGVGHDGCAHGVQHGILAAVDRNADVHRHGSAVRYQEERHAVRAAVLGHVHVAVPRVLRGRHSEQAERDHVDRVQENVEHDGHVGRCRGSGRARLPGRRHADHRAVRVHRGHRMYVERRVQNQSLGPVAQLRRAADGHHQRGRVDRRHRCSPVRRFHNQRSGNRFLIAD